MACWIETGGVADGIFLSQSKCAGVILSRSNMMSNMSVTTPLMMNLEKLCESASNSDLVDPMMYR